MSLWCGADKQVGCGGGLDVSFYHLLLYHNVHSSWWNYKCPRTKIDTEELDLDSCDSQVKRLRREKMQSTCLGLDFFPLLTLDVTSRNFLFLGRTRVLCFFSIRCKSNFKIRDKPRIYK